MAFPGFSPRLPALYFATQTGAGSPTIGTAYVLPAIAAVVIGGTSLLGGRGSLIGTDRRRVHPDADRRCGVSAQAAELLAIGMSGLILMLVVILTALTESRSHGEAHR